MQFSVKPQQNCWDPPNIPITQPSAAQAKIPPLHKVQGFAENLLSVSADDIFP